MGFVGIGDVVDMDTGTEKLQAKLTMEATDKASRHD